MALLVVLDPASAPSTLSAPQTAPTEASEVNSKASSKIIVPTFAPVSSSSVPLGNTAVEEYELKFRINIAEKKLTSVIFNRIDVFTAQLAIEPSTSVEIAPSRVSLSSRAIEGSFLLFFFPSRILFANHFFRGGRFGRIGKQRFFERYRFFWKSWEQSGQYSH